MQDELAAKRAEKEESFLREKPSEVLPMTSELLGAVTFDLETSGLHIDDGATTAAVAVAYRLKSEPDNIWHHAFAFDQGNAADKGFRVHYFPPLEEGKKLTKQQREMPKYAYPGKPMGDPAGRWDWDTDYNLSIKEWTVLCRWLQMAGKAAGLSNQNLKFDLAHMRNGTRFCGGVELEKYAVWDTMLASPLVWPYAGTTALKPVAERLWGKETVEEADLVKECLVEVSKRYGLKPSDKRYDLMPWGVNGPYASQDTVLAHRLAELQHLMISEGHGTGQQVTKAVQLMRVLRRMERRGLGPLDMVTATSLADEIDERLAKLRMLLPFEPHTGPRAATYFFDELGQEPWKVNEERRQVEMVEVIPPKRIRDTEPRPASLKRKVVKQGELTASVAKRMAKQGVPAAAEWAEIEELRIANQMFYRNYANLAGQDEHLRAALPLDEPVLTPHGWIPMGAISVGDVVIGSDGHATKVSGIPFHGFAQEWLVTLGDGAKIRCSGDHLWTIRTPNNNSRTRTTIGNVVWRTLFTDQLQTLVNSSAHVCLPDLDIVEYEPTTSLPIDPYLFGILMGDGYLTGTPSWTSALADGEFIAQYLGPRIPDLIKRSGSASTGGKSWQYRLVGQHTAKALRKLGMLGAGVKATCTGSAKYVPEIYLRASSTDRLALLRGLLDTDGCAHKEGHVRFCNTSEYLVDAVVELVRSLGGVARKGGYQPRLGVKRAYYVSIRMQVAPFLLPRKVANWKMPKTWNRLVKSVELVGREVLMQCISVEASDGLFVTSGLALTHNSFKQAFVRSGRLSAARVQLHGMPKKLGLVLDGREVVEPRKLILTPPGKIRMNLDLSQAELRIGALFCHCQSMSDALANGDDLHAMTAISTLGARQEDPDWKLKRDAGKQGNFSCIYGVGPAKFQTILWEKADIEWSLAQSRQFVYAWRDTYPEFPRAFHEWLEFAERRKFVPLIDGTPSWMTQPRDFPSSAWNRVVQGSLAVFVRDWLIMIEKRTAKYDALELSVHDSACLLLPEDCAEEVCAELAVETEEMWYRTFGIVGRADVTQW